MGDVIRATFRKSGLSIKQLADRSGIPYASAHGIVSGTRDPALSTVSKLAPVLGLELAPVRRRKGKKA
ncbi:MAG: helix-turn-helix domain-containing protein [Planctomycetota bacterium]